MTVTSFTNYFLLEGTLFGRKKDVNTAYQGKIFSRHGLFPLFHSVFLLLGIKTNSTLMKK